MNVFQDENFTNWVTALERLTIISGQSYDNLFSANHRNAMLQKYGYTEAMKVKVEDLI
jgi:hypothetical protein